MKTLHIREAVLADMPHVMKLIEQSDMSPDNRLTDEQTRELFQQIVDTSCHQLYVAELNSTIVGTFALIVVQQLSHNGARSIVVEDVVVKTDLQEHGIGQQMMSYAAEQAQALGCSKMILSSGVARTHAHNFYKNLGFKKDGHRFALNLKEGKRD